MSHSKVAESQGFMLQEEEMDAVLDQRDFLV